MAEGFIFDHNKCVACGACSAACILENRWSFLPRMIYTFNSLAKPSLPVLNLSLACNHCNNAVCMEGCPSSSYYRDPATGAIIIDDTKCIGCRYCQWNCPYDAPKYIDSGKVIGKCNLCYQRLTEGLLPACTTACPTGALDYGKLADKPVADVIPWFPEKALNPAIELRSRINPSLIIFPQDAFDTELERQSDQGPAIKTEWSLMAFSFLTTLSVAKLISTLISGIFPDKFQLFSIIGMAALISLLHPGQKRRSWRAVINIRHSPLTREIWLFILYSLLAAAAAILQLPVLLILSSVTGLILLMAIDAVYIFPDKQKSVLRHSGQTFITALLIVSFLTAKILPFIFISVIKLSVSVHNLSLNRDNSLKFVIRFVRTALLFIAGICLISAISFPETEVIALFLTGELLDRILFYMDFRPLNINRLINSHLIEAENEKERG